MGQQSVRLDELIGYINSQEGTPLDHVTAAMRVSEQLGELADHLIGHFVDQARRAGASWTEISQSTGVTKQAAQQRFVPRLSDWDDVFAAALGDSPGRFSRFTERARHAVARAHQEAVERRHGHVFPEHIVLGLLHEPDGLAAQAVQALGVSADDAREALYAAIAEPEAGQPPAGPLPFSQRAKRMLMLALREALRLGHNYIGTEHLLLGVLEDEQDEPGTMAALGVTKERAEQWLLSELERIAEQRRAS